MVTPVSQSGGRRLIRSEVGHADVGVGVGGDDKGQGIIAQAVIGLLEIPEQGADEQVAIDRAEDETEQQVLQFLAGKAVAAAGQAGDTGRLVTKEDQRDQQ